MSFVKTVPEALTSAAGQLGSIGENLAAQNASSLGVTTSIAPAGADPVSQLQAALFGTYGQLYQSISQQATAIHQQLVHTLGENAVTYAGTEQTNQATTSIGDGIQWFLTNIIGVPSSGSTSVGSGNAANIANIGFGNWASAGSDLIGLAGGGLLDFPEEAAEAEGGLAGLDGAVLVGAAQPVAPAAFGAAPVLAGVGQASTVAGLSVPPGWAAEPLSAAGTGAARLVGTGWTVAPPAAAPTATIPAGMPSVASAGRGATGLGTPRYGVKPTVLPKAPKPVVV
ncbi:PE domain-containing protein [Mycobacterium sp. pUA109]|uniref:PPE family protein, SVP subgroup n=1 Tax=Mycobacterium sp. pUA109 TaxID=3238982 RepID=UPI00351B700D